MQIKYTCLVVNGKVLMKIFPSKSLLENVSPTTLEMSVAEPPSLLKSSYDISSIDMIWTAG